VLDGTSIIAYTTSNTVSSTILVFNTTTQQWSSVDFDPISPIPPGRVSSSIVGENDAFYLFGGLRSFIIVCVDSHSGAQDNVILNELWIFSYPARFWLQVELPDEPEPRYLPSCAALSSDSFLIFGLFVSK
jgi:hypothetical protein